MKSRRWLWSLALATLLGIPAATRGQEISMKPAVVVVPHQNGSLALPVSGLASVWYRPGSGDREPQLRMVSPALSEPKVLAGDQAESAWRSIHQGEVAASFVFASHMEGTLAIPRAQIRSAYYSGSGAEASLRLMYDGDPSGKTLSGEEATAVWKSISE